MNQLYIMRHANVLGAQTINETIEVTRKFLGIFPYTSQTQKTTHLEKRIDDTSRQRLELAAFDISRNANGSQISIYSSPLDRAVFTAMQLEKLLPVKSITTHQDLSCDVRGIGRFLANTPELYVGNNVGIIISHQPDIRSYTGQTLGNCEYVRLK